MFIGRLSEREVEAISELLKSESIAYEVKQDDQTILANETSLQNDLRHLTPASISTHILAIELEVDAFDKMSDELKVKLLDYGITNEVPDDLEFSDPSDPYIHRQPENLLKLRATQLGAIALIILGFYLYVKFEINKTPFTFNKKTSEERNSSGTEGN